MSRAWFLNETRNILNSCKESKKYLINSKEIVNYIKYNIMLLYEFKLYRLSRGNEPKRQTNESIYYCMGYSTIVFCIVKNAFAALI